MSKSKYQILYLAIIIILFPIFSFSQVTLDSDGPGNTYELINSVLAPGFDVVEHPECNHPLFGRHIAEVWDADLNMNVFEFYIHVNEDNDRCINFDRQRVEIKTYDQSPANLIGVTGETVVYKWKFKIPVGFKPSPNFTHIHQVKAVGGNDDDPIFTLTPRYGSPSKIELIHNNTTKVTSANLSLFEGNWVEATEIIKIDSLHGYYSMSIKKVSDGAVLLSYSNSNLMTIRYNNTFIRPKWGIYRSLLTPQYLRDESLKFANFSIDEGATINVSTIAELQTAINNSSSGDIIVLANGTYLNNTINIGKSNITVKSATPGGVFLNGTNDINLTGNYIVFSGFQFISGDNGDGNVIEVTGSHNTLTQLNFNGYHSKKYIQLAPESQYCVISYCNIENKPADAVIGCTVQINTSPTILGYHKIRYCSFKNFPGGGGDYGNEPIRIGLSTEGTNTSAAVVEYCYFENTGMGDSETISLKCIGNVVRYCTFKNNPLGQLVFRHGKRNTAYANFFINSGGIRVKEGQNHMIFNNYFQGAASQSSLELMNYDVDPLDNIFVYHNTFYKPGVIEFGGTGLNPPTNVKFANNIIYKTSGTILSDLSNNISFLGNLYNGGASLGRTSTLVEFQNIDPQLVLNSSACYALSATSPAINASNGTYPDILDNPGVDDDSSILLDFEGQSRPTDKTQKDVGCDEYTLGAITNHPLVLSEVGPSYLGGPDSKLDQTIAFNALPLKTFGNPDFNPGATASSGLIVAYTSSNSSVATIVSGKIHILGAGTTVITASQAGDNTYNPAPSVSQTLTVVLPPSSYLDLSAWKLQTLSTSNTFLEIMSPELVAGFSSDLFYTSPVDYSIVFKVPSNGATTSGSTYPRTELRQMSSGANWELSDPTEHYLTAQCKVITVASDKPQTIIGQIHGSDDESELLKLRWTGYLPGQCFIEALYQANDAIRTEYKVKLAEGLSLGNLITYVISMKNGTITTTVDGNSASQTYTTNFYGTTDRYYFKAGNYLSYNGVDPIVIGQNQFYKLSLSRQNQTITFGALPTKVYGDSDFSPDATSSSGLTVSYSSSNNSVATIVNGNIHIVGAGTTDIIASQPGDLFYGAASDVIRTLTVSKKDQTISFIDIPDKFVSDIDFNLEATASSGLSIFFSSLNQDVAKITNGTVHIVGAGSTTIIASQVGDAIYNSAPNVSQTLTVSKLNQLISFDALPTKLVTDIDFSPSASATSGLPVTYLSSNADVATIVSGYIHIVGAGTSTIIASQAGDATYNEAQNVSQTLLVTTQTDIQDLTSENSLFFVYPNPASNIIKVNYSIGTAADVNLLVYNLIGKKVKILISNEHQQLGGYNRSFDLSELKNGVYFIHFNAGDYNKTIKLILNN